MKKIYHLSTCGTCKRVISDLKPGKDVIMQDVKAEKITPKQLDELAKLAGTYEALFSRVAMKYRTLGLDKKKLSENDYRNYMLEEYTFLRRPTVIVGNKVFVGSAKATILAAKALM